MCYRGKKVLPMDVRSKKRGDAANGRAEQEKRRRPRDK